MVQYFDESKVTLLRFADQLVRELRLIQDMEKQAKKPTRASFDYLSETTRVRQRLANAVDEPSLQRGHDDFAALATKVMFYRLAISLHLHSPDTESPTAIAK